MKTKILSAIAALCIIFFFFFWFQMRPAMIRAECGEKTLEKLKKDYSNGVRRSIKESDEHYDLLFKICVNERGLKN